MRKPSFGAVAVILLLIASPWLAAEGVTVVTHGWNPVAGGPAWLSAMQTAISDQYLGGERHLARITVTGAPGQLTATCGPWDVDLTTSSTGEIVVVVDWSSVANHLTSGVSAQEVAAVVAPRLYQGQGGQPALAELPIHLVGHSRGGGLVCEIARLLGEQGIEVDQLTLLDPHPLTSADPQPLLLLGQVIDTPVAIYENVLFADGYWQDIDYPTGEPVVGAYNRHWASLPGGYHDVPDLTYQDFADHLNILLVYHGTIDSATPTTNGEASLGDAERTSWFNDYEVDGDVRGGRTGFYYSRIARRSDRLSTDAPVDGGDRIVDGQHADPLLGGAGARSPLSGSSATWPNLVALEVLVNGQPLGPAEYVLGPGETVELRYVLRDHDSTSDVLLAFDADRNPYNANTIATGAAISHPASGAFLTEHVVAWDTSSIPRGSTGTVCGQIRDTTHTRYLCAASTLTVPTATGTRD